MGTRANGIPLTASSVKSLGLQGIFFFVSPGSTPSGNLMEIISTNNCLSQVALTLPFHWNLKSEVVSSSYPSATSRA